MLGLLLLHLHALISRKWFNWTQACLDNCIDFYLYSLYLVCVLNDIEGVRIPCLCILYSNATIMIYARTLGSFLISFRALFVQLVLWIFWLLASSVEVSSPFYYLQSLILGIVWLPSIYLSLDTCIWFHSYYEKCTPWGGTHTILAF